MVLAILFAVEGSVFRPWIGVLGIGTTPQALPGLICLAVAFAVVRLGIDRDGPFERHRLVS